MKNKYIVKKEVVSVYKYEVEAESEDEAVAMVECGDSDLVEVDYDEYDADISVE